MTKKKVEVWALVNMVLEDLVDSPRTEPGPENEPSAGPQISQPWSVLRVNV